MTRVQTPREGMALVRNRRALVTGVRQTFTATGGTGPYAYSLVSGGGTLSGAVYTAPVGPGTATVRVTDSQASSSAATIAIGGLDGTVVLVAALDLNRATADNNGRTLPDGIAYRVRTASSRRSTPSSAACSPRGRSASTQSATPAACRQVLGGRPRVSEGASARQAGGRRDRGTGHWVTP